MDKEGILGILDGLNAFMKTKNEQNTTQPKQEKSDAEQSGTQPETMPKELTFPPKLLQTISTHEKHLKNLGKKIIQP